MVLLLGSRGQYRGRRSSLFASVAASVAAFFGRARSPSRGGSRGARGGAGGLVLLFVALLGFVGGFFVRGQVVAASPAAGAAGLQAGPQAPGIVGEIEAAPLASHAFIVSVYPGLDAGSAQQRALQLSQYLRAQKLLKARPFEYASQQGPLWVVAVYFDGDAERAATRDKLLQLPADVPDTTFVELRKTEPDWPTAYPIR
ncbi:MAG: hypothetical protein KF830_01145 [Planctomycetes bacterium]|nr:hypothetical protein [Planctomycetota bacterium]